MPVFPGVRNILLVTTPFEIPHAIVAFISILMVYFRKQIWVRNICLGNYSVY